MPRPQFSLRALLLATALVGTGTLLARLAINDRTDNGFVFAEGAVSAFGAAAGSVTKRPHIWVVAGLLAGPALALLALIYAGAGIIFGY